MPKLFETNVNNGEIKPVQMNRTSDVLFLQGAIRAAKNSSPTIQSKIISDIQMVLNCGPEELNFLFSGDNDHNDHALYDFPDSERRRQIVRNNRLDAAE